MPKEGLRVQATGASMGVKNLDNLPGVVHATWQIAARRKERELHCGQVSGAGCRGARLRFWSFVELRRSASRGGGEEDR
jgi:hypothetical protein